MILVDALRDFDTTLRAGRSWCHMVSTVDEVELHAFAAKLGLRREWAQLRPKASAAHYDLVPRRRARAIELGAREVSARVLALANYDGMRRRGLMSMTPEMLRDLHALGVVL